MQSQNMPNMQGQQNITGQGTSHNHGAHELFDAHELIGGMLSMMDQYKLYEQQIQDQELKDILQRQATFMTQMYNTIVESFQTGQDPQTATQQYKMTQSNEVIYGLKPGQPKKPKQTASELTDECYSSFMLELVKGSTATFSMAALEMNNPIVRRIIADSLPNLIEMGYEIFLYQNKHGYYQVAQLTPQDMNTMVQTYGKAPQTNIH